ncbi:hypothetical protein MRX96_031240 [Rhipicephalus microplus]
MDWPSVAKRRGQSSARRRRRQPQLTFECEPCSGFGTRARSGSCFLPPLPLSLPSKQPADCVHGMSLGWKVLDASSFLVSLEYAIYNNAYRRHAVPA